MMRLRTQIRVKTSSRNVYLNVYSPTPLENLICILGRCTAIFRDDLKKNTTVHNMLQIIFSHILY